MSKKVEYVLYVIIVSSTIYLLFSVYGRKYYMVDVLLVGVLTHLLFFCAKRFFKLFDKK
jgi:hypothetical protein